MEPLITYSGFSAEGIGLTFSILLIYHNPFNPDDEPYTIIPLSIYEPAFDFSAAYTGLVSLDSGQQETAAKYQNGIILTAAIIKNKDGKIVGYSSTYSAEF